jgi:hypothetical protein
MAGLDVAAIWGALKNRLAMGSERKANPSARMT